MVNHTKPQITQIDNLPGTVTRSFFTIWKIETDAPIDKSLSIIKKW